MLVHGVHQVKDATGGSFTELSSRHNVCTAVIRHVAASAPDIRRSLICSIIEILYPCHPVVLK